LSNIGSKADYARWRRVTPSAISQHIASGKLRPALTEDGRVDFAAGDAILGQVLDPERGGDRRPDAMVIAEPALATARRRKLEAEAERAELELAQRRGQLVPVVEVRAGAQELATALAATLEQRRLELVRAVRACPLEGEALVAVAALDRKICAELGRRLARVVAASPDADQVPLALAAEAEAAASRILGDG
jgi:hypothetical protein